MLLLIVNVIGILFLHELTHAGFYYYTKRQMPEIGIRGFVIYAAAPNQVISRKEILINAIAPFIIISLLGFVAMTFFSPTIISWVFIPTLVNAAASGGDFMTIRFASKQSKTTYFNDVGDIIYALQPKQ